MHKVAEMILDGPKSVEFIVQSKTAAEDAPLGGRDP